MEVRHLGAGGPPISVVGYGAWEAGGDDWGPNQSEVAVIAAIHSGLDAGINWIDTAEIYGGGRSEELVGRALNGRRDQALIFTKVAPKGAGSGFRPDQVKRAIRASLQRLRTDHVDLYQLHWPSRWRSLRDTWGAMSELQDEGLAVQIGVSNFSMKQIELCNRIRAVASVQNEFSLIRAGEQGALSRALGERGIGYLCYSPLGKGLLTDAITKETVFDRRDARSGARGPKPAPFREGVFDRNLERVDQLKVLAEALGFPVSTLALRWLLEQPGVTAVIAGSRNPRHVRSNASAGELKLEPSVLKQVEAIFDVA